MNLPKETKQKITLEKRNLEGNKACSLKGGDFFKEYARGEEIWVRLGSQIEFLVS